MRGLRKAYGGRVVVDGLDLDVPAGEIVGLIGANGAGKTTTVECIQGLRKPDAGILRVLGYDPVTQAAELRPLIGSQLQDSALPDRLRVAEAVELFSTARARDGSELLSRFGLAERRRSAFGSLSGGERQRLFLVLALLNRPRLVILDELTQGLDPAARRNVWGAVRQLHDEGTTVLLVTHEMDEAEALCGRVVVMRAGRVLDAGAPADLVDRHAGTATIRFSLPDAPAPLLDQVRRLDGVHEVEAAGARVTVRGARPVIAYVGAALVRWGLVPADLSVHVPSLEDALLGLLDGSAQRLFRNTENWWEDGDEHRSGTAHPGRAETDDARSARADVRVRVPDRDHADHRRGVRDQAEPGVRPHQPGALVRGVLPDRGHRRGGAGHAAGAPGLLPGARGAAPVRGRGLPRWSFAVAQLVVGLITTAVACALLLAVAAPVYGLPALHDGWRVAVALAFGAVGFVSLGVLLGTLLPSARSAQAVGLLLFFPSFLLGAGGPPPHVMGSVVRHVAGPLPLTLLTNAVREPWLGLGSATASLVGLVALTVAFTAVAARRAVL